MKEDTREKILNASMQLMMVQGYNHTGISQILKQINVPKGSFYHYFKSKEALGLALVHQYGEQQIQFVEQLLVDHSESSAYWQLHKIFDYLIELFEQDLNFCNCLLGNFAQEMSLQSERFRNQINKQYSDIETIYEGLLLQAQKDGDIKTELDCSALAETLQAGWTGAITCSKLKQSVQPLINFQRIFFNSLK